MICDEVQPELEAYAQEELSPELRAPITAHLTDCDDCRAALTWVGGLADALRDAAPEPEVEVDPEAVTSAVLGQAPTTLPRPRRRRASGRTARPGSSRVLALAAVVLIAGLLALSLRAPADRDTTQAPTPSPPPPPTSTATRTAPPTPAPTGAPEPPGPTPTPTPAAGSPSPSPTPTASPVVTPSPIPSPTLTPTPTPAPTSVARQAGVAIARVSLRVGKPEVQRHGQSTWTPLALNGIVRTGDVVRAKRGVVGLSFPSGDPARASVDGRAQLALYRGQVTVGPLQSTATARLDRGECLVFTQQVLAIQVGQASVGVDGTTELSLNSNGKAGQVDVHAGAVVLATPAGRARFPAGRRVKLRFRPDGVDGRDRRFKVKTPAWWRRIERGLIARAAYLLDLRRFDRSEFEELVGQRPSDRPVLIGDAQTGTPTIRFGRSTPRGGLWTFLAGQRVRIRVRVSKPARIRLQLTDLTAKDNFHAESDPIRANTWVDLSYQPERFVDNAGRGRQISSGDLIGYLAVQARAKVPVTLELGRVLVAD